MNEASADAKNSVLCDGIYQYFSEKYGVRWSNSDKAERKRKNHDRALKRVKQLKKTARKEFQRAKREGLPPESIRALAQKLLHTSERAQPSEESFPQCQPEKANQKSKKVLPPTFLAVCQRTIGQWCSKPDHPPVWRASSC